LVKKKRVRIARLLENPGRTTSGRKMEMVEKTEIVVSIAKCPKEETEIPDEVTK